MNKKQLSERDICTKFIIPAVKQIASLRDALKSILAEALLR